MAERTLRGARLGGQSFEDERGIEFAARQQVGYRCKQGHDFEVTMSVEADIPAIWECPRCGAEALSTAGILPEAKVEKPARTHWDMLLERRSEKELEDILKERLELLRGGEIGPAHLHRANQEEAGLLGSTATRPSRPRRPGPPGPRARVRGDGHFRAEGPSPLRASGPTTSRLSTTVVSIRRATGRVTGRISRSPTRSSDEAGAQHQGAADEDQRPVGDLAGRHPAAAQASSSAAHARPPSRLMSQAPMMRPGRATRWSTTARPPADLEDGPDLHERHHHEGGHEHAHSTQPASGVRGASGWLTTDPVDGTCARRSDRPQRVIILSDSLAT